MNSTTLQSSDFQEELTGKILPFWQQKVPDPVNRIFYGALSNDLTIQNDVPRSSVLCARILWTFAAAYRRLGDASCLQTADTTCGTLIGAFWDEQYQGINWNVDWRGQAIMDRKHHYTQKLFVLLEEHARETQYGGYIGCNCLVTSCFIWATRKTTMLE